MSQITKNVPKFRDLTDSDLEGIVRCYCGCKYWDDLHCHSCGEKVTPELATQLADLHAFDPIR